MKKMLNFFLLLGISYVFQPIFAQTTASNCKCCTEAHRQFDFWLGDWKTWAGDKLAGTNQIVLMQDSCVIQENWTSANGTYTGTSYNYYNAQTQSWHQTWVDNQGGSLELRGGFAEGAMVMKSGVMQNAQGEAYINRISWTPNADGSVRQHWEVSKDEGKSWNTVFDGLYKRAAAEEP